jgi:hypothetical protein
MSTRDSRLSPEERAALAHLEAAATADDPNLATRLRGSGATRLNMWATTARRQLVRLSAGFLALRWWWGAAAAAVGLALVVLAVSAGLWLGVLGVLLMAAGLVCVGRALEQLIMRSRRRRSPGGAPD